MSPKKQYQKRLPAILPPPPRRPPELESRPLLDRPVPGPTPEAAPEPVRRPPPADDDARPTTDPGRPSGRAVLVWAVAIALVVGALVTGVVLLRPAADDPVGEPTTADASVRGWPTAGTSRTVTDVRRDGVLEVTQRIHTLEPIGDLELSLPAIPGADAVAVSAVEVLADDHPGSGPTVISSGRATYFFAPATRVLVRYQMSGAVELSTSAAQRGLASTTALEVSVSQERDTRVVRASTVLSLACVRRGRVAALPCGEEVSDRKWRVELTGGRAGARVLASVTVS